MRRSLFSKTTAIGIYFLLIFLCLINQLNASYEKSSHQNTTTFQNHMKRKRNEIEDKTENLWTTYEFPNQHKEDTTPTTTPILNFMSDNLNSLVIKYLTLREVLKYRQTCTLFQKSIPGILPQNSKYFKACLNYGYDENIGFIIEKYCTIINDSETRLLFHQTHTFKNLYFNSFAFMISFGERYAYGRSIDQYNGCGVIYGKFNTAENIYCVTHRTTFEPVIIVMNQGAIFAKSWTAKYLLLGDANYGGVLSENVRENIGGNCHTFCTMYTCAAWNSANNILFSWGNFKSLDEIPPPQEILNNVHYVSSNWKAIGAVLLDGTVLAWGHPQYGGKIPKQIQPLLRDVEQIVCNAQAFAALLGNGKVLVWGNAHFGGIIPTKIRKKLYNVGSIDHLNWYKFQATFYDGRPQLVWP